MDYVMANWTWLIPTGLIVADVIVKATPWHGDDDLIDALWNAYRKFTGKSIS